MTLGQLGPNHVSCGAFVEAQEFIQAPVADGAGYEVPENGAITSWSNNAAPGVSGQMLTMKVFRKVAEPAIYRVVGHDGPRPLNEGVLNTFSTQIPVQSGDLIGYGVPGSTDTSCVITPSMGSGAIFSREGNELSDGEASSFSGPSGPNNLLNLAATFTPSNAIAIGKTVLNKRKGSATLHLTLPNPGELTVSGKGVLAASAGQAAISKAVGMGAVQILVRSRGKSRQALESTGVVRLKIAITYTPALGDPATRSLKVKLKKK